MKLILGVSTVTILAGENLLFHIKTYQYFAEKFSKLNWDLSGTVFLNFGDVMIMTWHVHTFNITGPLCWDTTDYPYILSMVLTPSAHLIKKSVHVYMNLISQMTLYIWKCRHFDTTDCTHNFWCNQYWKFHHNDNISIAVYKVSISCAYHQTLLGFRYHLKVLMKVRQLMPCGPSSQMFPDPYCTSGINLLNNARWPQINSLLPVWKSCHFKHIHFKYMS